MKKILIFGATSAIAQATARILAARGAELFLVARNASRLEAVAADLETRGARVSSAVADLNDEDRHGAVIDEAVAWLGRLDAVLIAHGVLGDQREDEDDWARARAVLEVNFMSVAALLTRLAPIMAARGDGTLAVISSVAGDRGRQSNYLYGTAKAAVTTFLQGLRNRLHRKGVRVLTIKPGFVSTPMTANFKQGPLFVKPETVAKGIVRAMAKGKDVVYLPWWWRWIMWVIRSIPEPVFKRLRL